LNNEINFQIHFLSINVQIVIANYQFKLMSVRELSKRLGRLRMLLLVTVVTLSSNSAYAQPANDNCAAATVIAVPAGGYGLGTFTAAQADISTATVQTGETFAPAVFVAGLNKKSMWYKFSISTIRAVRVTLTQPGTAITAGDVGFAVYQASNCLPGNGDISLKLTPIVTFGNTYHPCVPSGEYYIQVSSNQNANGPVTVQVEISDQTGAAYDHPNQAYSFGTVGNYSRKIDFNTECQSIEDATELCNGLANSLNFNKTAWMTFTTPAYFDYLVVQLSGTGASYYFPSNNNQPIKRTFGYTLYKGNAVTTPIASLQTVHGCDSIQTDGNHAAYKMYKCSDLQPNTTYSIQLFIKKDFGDDVRLGIIVGGQGPTKSPKPALASVPSPNAVGNLAASPNGTLTSVEDVWGCNSRHSTSACGPALPDSGILFNNARYTLSSFVTFKLTTTCAVSFHGYPTQCGPSALVRVFKQSLTNSCTGLDTSNLVGAFVYNGTIDCLPPGDYVVQVSGQDHTDWYGRFHSSTPLYNNEQCLSTNLGTRFKLDIRGYTRKAANKFSLDIVGAVDSINKVGGVMQPLQHGVPYLTTSDTIGCRNTVRPSDTTCNPTNNKVIYREFIVNDSGVVHFSTLTNPHSSNWRYKLYSGSASSLAAAQNAFAFPDRVNGLTAKSLCLDAWVDCHNKSVCVVPGTYTFVSIGNESDVGRVDRPTVTFWRTRTKHYSPETAQNLGSIMDTLGPNGGSITTDVDDWSCSDNAVPINGAQPCIVGGKRATKAIYRQFYLKAPALVRIENIYYWYCMGRAYGTKSLFYGKATDGISGLTPVGGNWSCFQAAGSTNGCELLPQGWYTVVSYNQGPSYDSTMRSVNLENRYNSAVSYNDEYRIIITPTCAAPKYNRPHLAAVDATNQPFTITWGDKAPGTTAYPKRDSVYTLPKENFNCIVDTPFSSHPIKACAPTMNRVAYYVFKTTQVSFLQINAKAYFAAVYDKDVRTDSSLFGTRAPLQPCTKEAGFIQFCFFQPGTYTLVIFAGNADVCKSVTPTIHITDTGYSRFDFAKNAYDFGVVPADSAWHFGKVGDVNPLNSGRKPSNDFFYCTTGASSTDPTNAVCQTAVNPNVYTVGPNKPLYDSAFPPTKGVARRNLWYTFVIDKPGYVKVKLDTKIPGREYRHKFSVYSSNVDGTLPFSTVVSTGQVDSTVTQGLSHIITSPQNWYYCANLDNVVTFYRDPCSNVATRYYLLVEVVNADPYEDGGTLPNTQCEVSILIDSVNLVLPKHDHYYNAGNIGTVGVGTFTGDTDNYSCATKDATDPIYNYYHHSQCRKTLWYKFTPTITGNVRYRVYINGERKYDYWDVQLFRQIIPGDSTTSGLQIQGYQGVTGSDNTYWAQTCVSPGTYYLLLPGCAQVGAFVYPEIQLIEAVGDFCNRAVPAVLNGAGSVSATLSVNCHTIGTDYGEFGPQLTCPQGANTQQYKSSWFRMDIGGTDTLDVTTYLVENTNAASSDIKYRLMTGNCGAMQEQSCVLDALTQNTYQCLVPGQSYYVQVFTPVTKFNQAVTGTIDLKLSAVAHQDTCSPLNSCLATANFTSQFNCNTDTAVRFINYSTFGSAIQFEWDFGYGGQTSTAVSPTFSYPYLQTAATYTVTLKVRNTSCGGRDSVVNTITIPARPAINLPRDTTSCTAPANILLDATTWTGTTYTWSTGATTPSINASTTGSTTYWVKGTFNGCSTTDTVRVHINPIMSKRQTLVLCPATDSVQLNSDRNAGESHSWSTGATTSSIWVKQPGTYYNNVRWKTCPVRDTFLVVRPNNPFPPDTFICLNSSATLNATSPGAVSYQWQNGATTPTLNITSPGQYWVQINYQNCNVRDTVNVSGLQPIIRTTNASICSGQTYTLPSGIVVSTAGTYSDTLRSASGCDSLISSVVLAVNATIRQNTSASICSGQNYTLPWGTIVNTPGVYSDTLRYSTLSCDSLIRIVTLSVKTITRTSSSASICAGQSFTLPSGTIVSASGTYQDTVRYVGGCDSLISTITLSVRPVARRTVAATICQGESYVLPSGVVVNAPGTYNDTLRYVGGCDSLITTVALSLRPLTRTTSAATICQGQSYTLPSGAVVSTAGNYLDTVRYASGCDSLITTLSLSVRNVTRTTTSATICNGHSYTLPSGIVVNAAGTYLDTLRYSSGCDSLITTVNLSIRPVARTSLNPVICQGQTYVAPSGMVLTTAGSYSDTLRYTSGCDSLITSITLSVRAVTRGSSSATICQGHTYTLPSGTIVTTSGIYSDTLRYVGGCDSLISTITLSVKPLLRAASSPVICSGQSYTLPSGISVNRPGVYHDTLRYLSGCDSVIHVVTLLVRSVTRTSTSASICQGQNYVLPSGTTVNAAGVYNDTLRYSMGCDSLITTLTLSVRSVSRVNTSASICQGAFYTLPSGVTVNTQGIHVDTLRYVQGCDSLITTVNLSIRQVTRSTASASICEGRTYTLPSGTIVSSAGIYNDTIRYVAGCDSLITVVNLQVSVATRTSVNAAVCAGKSYTLPSGTIVSAAGTYLDTLKSRQGCDSVITTVQLRVNSNPVVRLSKSNDISCVMGTAKLNATGGSLFVWSPQTGLSDAFISNPTASPTTTTRYKVQVTSLSGCTSVDSIEVKVVPGGTGTGYLVPTAFTPNGDNINDCFGVRSWGAVTDLQFRIFNRWGQLVFSTTNVATCWDGKYKGYPAETGAYVYRITANTICGPVVRNGSVVLLR
jgi:gliding motility-associated-like protein